MAEGWTITGQRETTQLTASNEYIDVMEVTFTTNEGVTGKITIPLGLYTAEYVRQQIEQRVASIKEVGGL